MLLLGVNRVPCHLNETLGHTKLNYVKHGGGVWVKWKGEFEKDETQMFTGNFLVMFKILKLGR